MNSAKKQKTIDYYDNGAKEWVSAHGRGSVGFNWLPQMQRFQELLPSGSILEIGAGEGLDAKTLISMGYKYTGTDASKSLVEFARKNNPGAKFVNVAVEDLDFPDDLFDGFWAAAVLLHIPKEDIDNALQSIKKHIRNGGIGFITLKEGDGEKEEEVTGRWFAYYREEEFKKILERNGFKAIEYDKKADEREGKPNWLRFFVKV